MDWEAIIIVPAIVIGMPWLILHYVTKWKTAATITSDDEVLLEELYNLAKRLDERIGLGGRLIWQAKGLADASTQSQSVGDRLERRGRTRAGRAHSPRPRLFSAALSFSAGIPAATRSAR